MCAQHLRQARAVWVAHLVKPLSMREVKTSMRSVFFLSQAASCCSTCCSSSPRAAPPDESSWLSTASLGSLSCFWTALAGAKHTASVASYSKDQPHCLQNKFATLKSEKEASRQKSVPRGLEQDVAVASTCVGMYRQCVVLMHSKCFAGKHIQECRRAGDLA